MDEVLAKECLIEVPTVWKTTQKIGSADLTWLSQPNGKIRRRLTLLARSGRLLPRGGDDLGAALDLPSQYFNLKENQHVV